MDSQRHKRMRSLNEESSSNESAPVSYDYGNKHVDNSARCYNPPNNNGVLALPKILEDPAKEKYGSVTKEYEKVHLQCTQFINYLYSVRSSLTSQRNPVSQGRAGSDACDAPLKIVGETTYLQTSAREVDHHVNNGAIVMPISENEKTKSGDSCHITKGEASKSVIVIDSDEEDQEFHLMCSDIRNTKVDASFSVHLDYQPSVQYHQVILKKANDIEYNEEIQEKFFTENGGESSIKRLDVKVPGVDETVVGTLLNSDHMSKDSSLNMENHQEDEYEAQKSDGLEDLWKEMSLALEYSKSSASDCPAASIMVEKGSEDCDHEYHLKDEEELVCQICGDIKKSCDHDYVLKDDIGVVCRICGVIKKSITHIFDFQWKKASQTARTTSGSRKSNNADENISFLGPKLFEEDMISGELSVHPRHLKQMKPHQVEGFNFLVRNLVCDNPGGCILAHAPGSGKTFMLISFIQSFLAKYPSARPLIILPKGILPIWKKEFQRWQVEEIPLHDFYSVKADSRSQQLGVMKRWKENRSILFLGYKQFSTIVCDAKDQITSACKEALLNVPSLLILDEGHTPRNENTNILSTLEKVATPLKVVLSGTLFQNHVREVFNILNLVRRKFLKRESSRDAVRRILSRASISRRHLKADMEGTFCDIVEETLQNDEHSRRRASVIQDLREMTQDVLHYYKGDFLDELPGYIDFTVLLNLSSKQKEIIRELRTYEKFKGCAVGSAVYLHPCLKDSVDYAPGDKSARLKDQEIDDLLESIDLKDGVKTKFVLNILSLADTAGEKVLVFSQYILPLRFLERLILRIKGWRSGKETFMISGETNTEQREKAMDQFNQSSDAKVLFGSIRACGEGISLVGASRVIILDVHLNPSVSRQAIGRAFRPGQTKKVYTYRLVAADSPEERDHQTCFRKELISKMWFEWTEHSGCRDFELESVDIQDSQDIFLDHLPLVEDIKSLYTR